MITRFEIKETSSIVLLYLNDKGMCFKKEKDMHSNSESRKVRISRSEYNQLLEDLKN